MSVESESVEGTVDGEDVGELPKMRDMSKRRAHRSRKQGSMKELLEERQHLGQTLEGYMSSFQDQQEHMQEMERHVEQMKEREKQKAMEMQKWQATAEERSKESMKLKKQLAVAMERLSRSERSGVELPKQTVAGQDAAAVSIALERMEMRLADYESLIAEFALQTEIPAMDEPTGGTNGNSLHDDERGLFQARLNTVMDNLQVETAKTSKLSEAHERLLNHSQELQSRCDLLQQALDASEAGGHSGTQGGRSTQALAVASERQMEEKVVLDQSVAMLEKRLATAEGERDAAVDSRTSLQTELEALKLKLINAEEKLDKTFAELESTRALLGSTTDLNSIAERSSDISVAQAESTQLVELQARCEALQEELDAMRTSAHGGALEGREQQAEEKAVLEHDVAMLQKQLAATEGERDEARECQSTLQGEIGALKLKLEGELGALKLKLRASEDEAEKSATDSARELAPSFEEVAGLEEADFTAAEAAEELQGTQAQNKVALDQSVAMLEKQLATAEEERAAAVDSRTSLQTELEALKLKLVDAEEKLDTTTVELEAARALQEELDALRTSAHAGREDKGALEHDIVMLQKQLAATEGERDAAREDQTTLQSEVAALKLELRSSDDGLAVAAQDLQPQQVQEQMDMRLADYESLITEFVSQTNAPATEIEDDLVLARQDRDLLHARMDTVMVKLQQEVSNSNKLSEAHERLLSHSQELQSRCNLLQAQAVHEAGSSVRLAQLEEAVVDAERKTEEFRLQAAASAERIAQLEEQVQQQLQSAVASSPEAPAQPSAVDRLFGGESHLSDGTQVDQLFGDAGHPPQDTHEAGSSVRLAELEEEVQKRQIAVVDAEKKAEEFRLQATASAERIAQLEELVQQLQSAAASSQAASVQPSAMDQLFGDASHCSDVTQVDQLFGDASHPPQATHEAGSSVRLAQLEEAVVDAERKTEEFRLQATASAERIAQLEELVQQLQSAAASSQAAPAQPSAVDQLFGGESHPSDGTQVDQLFGDASHPPQAMHEAGTSARLAELEEEVQKRQIAVVDAEKKTEEFRLQAAASAERIGQLEELVQQLQSAAASTQAAPAQPSAVDQLFGGESQPSDGVQVDQLFGDGSHPPQGMHESGSSVRFAELEEEVRQRQIAVVDAEKKTEEFRLQAAASAERTALLEEQVQQLQSANAASPSRVQPAAVNQLFGDEGDLPNALQVDQLFGDGIPPPHTNLQVAESTSRAAELEQEVRQVQMALSETQQKMEELRLVAVSDAQRANEAEAVVQQWSEFGTSAQAQISALSEEVGQKKTALNEAEQKISELQQQLNQLQLAAAASLQPQEKPLEVDQLFGNPPPGAQAGELFGGASTPPPPPPLATESAAKLVELEEELREKQAALLEAEQKAEEFRLQADASAERTARLEEDVTAAEQKMKELQQQLHLLQSVPTSPAPPVQSSSVDHLFGDVSHQSDATQVDDLFGDACQPPHMQMPETSERLQQLQQEAHRTQTALQEAEQKAEELRLEAATEASKHAEQVAACEQRAKEAEAVVQQWSEFGTSAQAQISALSEEVGQKKTALNEAEQKISELQQQLNQSQLAAAASLQPQEKPLEVDQLFGNPLEVDQLFGNPPPAAQAGELFGGASTPPPPLATENAAKLVELEEELREKQAALLEAEQKAEEFRLQADASAERAAQLQEVVSQSQTALQEAEEKTNELEQQVHKLQSATTSPLSPEQPTAVNHLFGDDSHPLAATQEDQLSGQASSLAELEEELRRKQASLLEVEQKVEKLQLEAADGEQRAKEAEAVVQQWSEFGTSAQAQIAALSEEVGQKQIALLEEQQKVEELRHHAAASAEQSVRLEEEVRQNQMALREAEQKMHELQQQVQSAAAPSVSSDTAQHAADAAESATRIAQLEDEVHQAQTALLDARQTMAELQLETAREATRCVELEKQTAASEQRMKEAEEEVQQWSERSATAQIQIAALHDEVSQKQIALSEAVQKAEEFRLQASAIAERSTQLEEDVSQVEALSLEKEALENAFRSQFQEAQQNISALNMEREALKQQVADLKAQVNTKPDDTRQQSMDAAARAAADEIGQLHNEREALRRQVADLMVKAAPEALQQVDPAAATADEVQKLHRRLEEEKEEKEMMMASLRENIKLLVRENYDLRHRPTDASSEASTSPGTETPPEVEEEELPAGGGFLSYFLSPFLTESDKREIHVEAYMEKKLGSDAAAS